MNPDEWAALLKRRRAEEAIIAQAFDLRQPTRAQVLAGDTRSYYAPPLAPEYAPIPGGRLEAWFLRLLDGPDAGSRVRLAREGDVTRRERDKGPYGTVYGVIVAPRTGDHWYCIDHLTDGLGARWRHERAVFAASFFADSACPDPVQPGWEVDRAERERRWRVAWDLNRGRLEGNALPTLVCDRCGHTARSQPASPCVKCWNGSGDSSSGYMGGPMGRTDRRQ